MRCEWCHDELHPEVHVVERPDDARTIELSSYAWVIDPCELRFCNEECQQRWYTNYRSAIWEGHPENCACVQCLG